MKKKSQIVRTRFRPPISRGETRFGVGKFLPGDRKCSTISHTDALVLARKNGKKRKPKSHHKTGRLPVVTAPVLTVIVDLCAQRSSATRFIFPPQSPSPAPIALNSHLISLPKRLPICERKREAETSDPRSEEVFLCMCAARRALARPPNNCEFAGNIHSVSLKAESENGERRGGFLSFFARAQNMWGNIFYFMLLFSLKKVNN